MCVREMGKQLKEIHQSSLSGKDKSKPMVSYVITNVVSFPDSPNYTSLSAKIPKPILYKIHSLCPGKTKRKKSKDDLGVSTG